MTSSEKMDSLSNEALAQAEKLAEYRYDMNRMSGKIYHDSNIIGDTTHTTDSLLKMPNVLLSIACVIPSKLLLNSMQQDDDDANDSL